MKANPRSRRFAKKEKTGAFAPALLYALFFHGCAQMTPMSASCQLHSNAMASALDGGFSHRKAHLRPDDTIRSGARIKHKRLLFGQSAFLGECLSFCGRVAVKEILPAHGITLPPGCLPSAAPRPLRPSIPPQSASPCRFRLSQIQSEKPVPSS